MTSTDFRRIALALTGVVEAAHMGHPDFRVGNRIFATLHADDLFGMVNLAPEQQQTFIAEYPKMFTPEAGAWGRQGCTRVHLASVHEEVLGEALTLARQHVVNKRPAKRSTASTRTKRQR